jgi:hypothetical protein
VSRRITQREHEEHSCHLQLLEWPDTAEPCRAKEYPLHPRRSYFAPIRSRCAASLLWQGRRISRSLWWRRRVPPPGPIGLLRYPFIAIAGEPAAYNIANRAAVGKMTARKLDKPQQVSHGFLRLRQMRQSMAVCGETAVRILNVWRKTAGNACGISAMTIGARRNQHPLVRA